MATNSYINQLCTSDVDEGVEIAAKVSIDFTEPTRIELLLVSRRCVFDDSLKSHLYSGTIHRLTA